MSVSTDSCEGEVALEVDGESSRDSELPRTFIHSITVVPVAVLEPDRDLENRRNAKIGELSVFCRSWKGIHKTNEKVGVYI